MRRTEKERSTSWGNKHSKHRWQTRKSLVRKPHRSQSFSSKKSGRNSPAFGKLPTPERRQVTMPKPQDPEPKADDWQASKSADSINASNLDGGLVSCGLPQIKILGMTWWKNLMTRADLDLRSSRF